MKPKMKSTRKWKIKINKANIVVTGGSGSLGRNIIKTLIKKGAKTVVSLSRDEGLIKEAEAEINSPRVTFKIGDINDATLVKRLLKDVDIIFHTAALKHVSLAEQNPREAHRINALGTLNLLDNSMNVKRFIHISSDKAIGVMNCYGATKLLGEYLVRETNSLNNGNEYLVVRCPNILGSRGSVIDVWKNQIKKENKIRITDPEMTRYFITLPEAARFIVNIGFDQKSKTDKIYYPINQTQKFVLEDLAQSFIEIFGNKSTKLDVIGALPGEKKHEDYIQDVNLTPKTKLKKILQLL